MIEDVRDGVKVLAFEHLAREASLRHVVTTRRGNDGGEFRPDLFREEDRRQIAELLGVRKRPIVFVNQVHGNRVLVVDADTADGCVGDADGLVTGEAGTALAVKGADCPLVLLYDPDRPAVALVHSGWRGTAAHVVRNAVSVMARRFGSLPDRLLAGISPAIERCCYEVGEEVAAQFEADFPPGIVIRSSAGKRFVDLPAAVRHDLRDAGLVSERIESAGLCTSCRADLLYSYRRDGHCAGRNVLLAGLT